MPAVNGIHSVKAKKSVHYKLFNIMSTKTRGGKSSNKYAAKDSEDRRKFVTVLVIATLALMVLMYFLFVK